MSGRILACLDVRDGRVVKGVQFRNHQEVGDPVALAQRYQLAGADELVFYDIGASPAGTAVDLGWVERVAAVLAMPFCVAGGIASVSQARAVLKAGADRVSVNSPALARPALIDELVDALGPERVVVGVDSLRDADGRWRVRQYSGDEARMRALARPTLEWLEEIQQRGAGEIVLNCMAADGVQNGYDLEQLAAARAVCKVRLVASGGAGQLDDFIEVFEQVGVDGALAASAFHSGQVQIARLKHELELRGLRPARLRAGELR